MMISIGSELEPKDNSNTMMEMVSNSNGNGRLPQDSKDKFMHCVSNCEDSNFGEETWYGVEEGKICEGTEDMEINITECTNSGMNSLVVAECQDATENSSSLGGTLSGVENDSAISDVEVESALRSGNSLGSMFESALRSGNPLGILLRKRKLTDHWRRFVRPLMWRCKWLELQLKKFKSQALKYDKELAEYDQRKNFEYEKLTAEGHNVKSQPFPCQIQRKKVMKRRKRKRVEDTADLASYMSNHNFFSYYDSKKLVATAAQDGDNGNLGNKMVNSNEDGFSDGLSSLEFRDSDIWLEKILGKIDVIQSQVHKLKTRVDNVINESPQKFSSINVLSSVMPCNTLAGSRSFSSPSGSRERILVTSQHLSGGNMGDLFMPGSNAVSSHGEVAPFADMIEGTAQNSAAVSYDNTEDAILIQDQAAKEELCNFQRGLTQQAEEPPMPTEKPTILAPGDDPPADPSVQPSESKNPNNKRNMEKRKSGTEEQPMPTEKPLAPGDDLPANPSVQPDAKVSLTSESKIPDNKRKMGKQNSGTEEPPVPTEKLTVLAPEDDLPANPSVQPDVKVSSLSESKVPNNKRKRGKRKSGIKEPLMPTEKTIILAPGDDLRANTSSQPDAKVSPSSKFNVPNYKRKRGERKSGTGWWSRKSSG